MLTLPYQNFRSMTKQEFAKEISEEIIRIKSMATTAEKAKLNIEHFYKGSTSGTVYGLLTGRHDNARANEITKKKYRHLESGFSRENFNSGSVVTALEKYMYYFTDKSKENKDILDFIKGIIPSITISIDGYNLPVKQSSSYFELHEVNEIKI